jgi:catechol 2,3-dioxygenase-like lactoylglutathione lyase family enzyme
MSPVAVGPLAFGIAVGDLDAALAGAERAGASVVGRSDRSGLFSAAAVTIRDPNRITFDLVHDPDATNDASRLAHLRVNCRDLDASIRWYEQLGFAVRSRNDEVAVDEAAFGVAGRASMTELTLPDEPMGLLLVQWLHPEPLGAHYACANHRGIYRVAIGVDDTRAAVQALEALAVPITRQPELLELAGTPVPDMWIAFLADPDGVPVELVERPRSAFRDAPRE